MSPTLPPIDPPATAQGWTADYTTLLEQARLVSDRREGADLVLAYAGAVRYHRPFYSRRHRFSRAVHHGEIRFTKVGRIDGVDHRNSLADPDLDATRKDFTITLLRVRPGQSHLGLDRVFMHDSYPESFHIDCESVILTRRLTVGRTLARWFGARRP